MKQYIVKLPKKVKYTLEIEQEESTDCSECPLSFQNLEYEDERECVVTHDLVGSNKIPDNCPLKKVKV